MSFHTLDYRTSHLKIQKLSEPNYKKYKQMKGTYLHEYKTNGI